MKTAKDVQAELRELEKLVSATAKTLAVIDFQLGPYWTEKGHIEHDIKRTHKRRPDGAIVFYPAGAPDRVPLFAQLDELAREWGPLKTDRNIIKTRLGGYERDARRLVNEMKYLKRKEGKNDTDQKTLF